MVVTGYFAQIKKYKEKGLELISIARHKPEWLTEPIKEYSDLFPTFEMLYNFEVDKNVDKFIISYQEVILSKLSPEKVYNDLNGKIILTAEKPIDFSHRHLVAYWLMRAGYSAKEFNVSNAMFQRTWLNKV